MKFHRIALENLNSLYGEHTIDFEEHLKGAAQFLIVGPTGSGKSTILDAVCLALFGVTPRLTGKRKTKAWETTDPREIMSFGERTCFAEVEFSKLEAKEGGGQHAVRYVARWSCHRSKQGNLQTAKRNLWIKDATSGEEGSPLGRTDLAKDSADVFEEVLEGLDVDQFKRVVLLAQGQFSVFLKADEKKRQDILARLMPTRDYEAVGRVTADRWRAAKDDLKARSTEVDLLVGGERAQDLRDQDASDLEGHEGRMRDLETSLQARMGQHDWLQGEAERSASLAASEDKLRLATQAEQAFAPQQKRLTEHQRCCEAQPFLEPLRESKEEIKDLEKDLQEEGEKLAALAERLEEAQSAQDEAGQAFLAAKTAYTELKPEIDEAKRISGILKSKQETLRGVSERTKAQAAEFESAQVAVKEREALADGLEEKRAAAEKARDQHAQGDPLSEKISGLQADLTELEKRHEELKKRRSDLGGLKSKIEEQGPAIAAIKAQVVENTAALESLDAAFESAELGLQTCHAGSEDAAGWRSSTRERASALQDEGAALGQLLEDRSEYLSALADEKKAGVTLEETLAQAHSAAALETKLAEELKKQEREAELASAELKHMAWQRTIAQERGKLEAGEACPLCGGHEHPFRDDTAAAEQDALVATEFDRLEAEANRLEKIGVQTRGELRAAEKKHAQLKERALGAEKNEQDSKEGLTRRTRGYERSIERSGLSGDTSSLDEETVEARQQAVAAELTALAAAAARLELAETALRGATSKRHTAQQELTGLQGTLGKAEARLTGLEEQDKALQSDVNSLNSDAEGREALLRAAFDAAGLSSDTTGEPLRAVLNRGTTVVAAWKSACTRLTDSTASLVTATSELAAERTKAGKAEAALEGTRGQKALLESEIKGLEEAAAKELEGQDPLVVEKKHQAKIEGAEKTDAASRKACAGVRSAHTTKEETLKQLRERRKGAESRRSSSQAMLDERLQALDVKTREELEAILLTPDAVQSLEAQSKSLRDDCVGWRKASTERRATLDAWTQKRPEGCDWEVETLETLARHLEQQRQELKTASEEAGAVRERLKKDAEAQKKRREHQAQREEAQKTLDRWDRLYNLIGRDNGLAFKRYVLALTLGQLIQRANSQFLNGLTSRYHLVAARDAKGKPRLAFEIIDRIQSNRRRSVNSLSGGETFLVSLGLALALASFRTSTMRIETLFLDEGFGTLDRETLDTAMAALTEVQSDGTQVGIITHVQGLQERIPVQVRVVPLGSGRSEIKFA